jgi:hypothetical protein
VAPSSFWPVGANFARRRQLYFKKLASVFLKVHTKKIFCSKFLQLYHFNSRSYVEIDRGVDFIIQFLPESSYYWVLFSAENSQNRIFTKHFRPKTASGFGSWSARVSPGCKVFFDRSVSSTVSDAAKSAQLWAGKWKEAFLNWPIRSQGCQIFLGTTYQNGRKNTKSIIKYTKMTVKHTKWP